MTVCRFFQQGECRYGQYCRFEHITYGQPQSYVQGDPAARSKTNTTYTPTENTRFITGIIEEILACERGKQWILSCFGPKDERCIPGMEDVSPEEVRWQIYEAKKNGTIDQVKMQYQQMCQSMKAMHEALKHPTPEITAMLIEFHKPVMDKPNPFASSQMSATQNNTNVFAKKANTFGNNTFASNTASSAFGNNSAFGASATMGTNQGIFGGANTSSVFGAAAQNTQQPFGGSSIFGGASSQPTFQSTAFSNAPTINVFAKPQTTQAGSVFANATTAPGNSVFGAQPNAGIFGNQMAQANNSVFGATPTTPTSTSVFGQQKAAQGFGAAPVFGNMATSPFANAQTGTSVFASPSAGGAFAASGNSPFAKSFSAGATQPTFAASPPGTQNQFSTFQIANAAPANVSPFGNNAAAANYSPFVQKSVENAVSAGQNLANAKPFQASNFVIANTIVVDESAYSKEEDLTEEDRKAFEAEHFTWKKIPTRPPTKALR